MKKDARIIVTLLVLTLVLSLVMVPVLSAAKYKGELTVTTYMPELIPGLELAAKGYKKIHPGITVKIQGIPYPGLKQWVKTQLIGGTAPDVILEEPPDWNDLAAQDLVLNLDPYMNQKNPYGKAKTWKEDFQTPYLDMQRDAAGKINMAPWTLFGVGILYNADAFKKAGVTKLPKTYAEWAKVNEKLQNAGYTPFYSALKPNDAQIWWQIQMMLNAMLRPKTPQINLRHKPGWKYDYRDPRTTVGEIYTADELYVAYKKGLIDPAKAPEFRAAYSLIKAQKKFYNRDLLAADGNDVYNAFVAGKGVQFINGTWTIPTLLDSMEQFVKDGTPEKAFKWAFMDIPTITTDDFKGLSAGGFNPLAGLRVGWIVAPNKDAARQEAAVDFLRYLTAPKTESAIFKLVNPKTKLPYVGDIPAAAGVARNAFNEKINTAAKYGEIQMYMFGMPPVFDMKDFDEYNVQIQKYFADQISLDDFLAERSRSNLAALERNLKLYADQIDQKWIDEQLK